MAIGSHLIDLSDFEKHEVEMMESLSACKARGHHQPPPVCDGHADLHTKFVGLPGLALADALCLRRVQGIQLVLFLRALAADALGAAHQLAQPVDR